MKIVITAGGTSEKIDDVRTITNSSTGRLGYAVGTAFLQQYADELEAVYYLHGTRARHPEHEKVIPVEIGGVADLQRELGRILAEEKIDAVVHAMAVSDYLLQRKRMLHSLYTFPTLHTPLPFPLGTIRPPGIHPYHTGL